MVFLVFIGGLVLGLLVGLVLGWVTPTEDEFNQQLADIRFRRQIGDGL